MELGSDGGQGMIIEKNVRRFGVYNGHVILPGSYVGRKVRVEVIE
jgi:putative transposon-encoded protein